MVEAATDILSLARLKRELRVPSTDTSRDTMLTEQIKSSASWVEDYEGAVYVDRTFTVWSAFEGKYEPLELERNRLRTISKVRYWEPDQSLNEAPAGETLEWGRYEQHPGYEYLSRLWPPDAGWPDTIDVPVVHMLIDGVIGIDIIPDRIPQAMILFCRHLFNGYGEMRPGHAAFRLLNRKVVV